jgi:hypothetical protein
LPPACLELDSYFHTCTVAQGPKGRLLIIVQSTTGEIDGAEAGEGNCRDDMGVFGGQERRKPWNSNLHMCLAIFVFYL